MSEQANPGMGETLVQIRIEMAKLGEKIDQLKDLHKEVKAVDDTAKEALQSTKAAHKRLDTIEAGQTWLWRTVAAAIIVGAIGLVFSYLKTAGG